MPRAWQAKELKAEMPLSQGAALILQVKLPELFHSEAGVIRGGVKPVHDMRIGSKRMREAVRVFKLAIPAKDRARLLPMVEQFNDLLGEIRERDVLRQALLALKKEPSEATPPAKLLRQLKRERRRHHEAFVAFLEELRASDFEKSYAELMKRMLGHKGEQPTIAAFAAQAVSDRLQTVTDNMEVIFHASSAPDFHRQRIRVKKLKYALEPFLAILPKDVKPLYDLIAQLQELMGQVHDVDVLIELLGKWWDQQDEETEAVDATLAVLGQQRKELLKETVAHARLMRREKFDVKLRAALASALPPERPHDA